MPLSPVFAAPMAVGLGITIVSITLGVKVGGARKKYDVPYPTMYADKDHKYAKEFNCIQRGHQNFLETTSTQLMLLTVGSLSGNDTVTLVNALGVGLYLISRMSYASGYATGDPAKRAAGNYGYLGLLTAMLCAIFSIAKVALPDAIPF